MLSQRDGHINYQDRLPRLTIRRFTVAWIEHQLRQRGYLRGRIVPLATHGEQKLETNMTI